MTLNKKVNVSGKLHDTYICTGPTSGLYNLDVSAYICYYICIYIISRYTYVALLPDTHESHVHTTDVQGGVLKYIIVSPEH
jgi:hypothetical protein